MLISLEFQNKDINFIKIGLETIIMYKQKLGMSLLSTYECGMAEAIKIISDCGFDAISPVWTENYDIESIANTAYKNNLTIQSLHAPFDGSAAIWRNDKDESEKLLKELFASLEDAGNYKIPVLVLHTWHGFENIPNPSEAGISKYEKLVNKASEYGIKIAFENTEGEEFLAALMDYFKGNDTVGFCWDSGHEMCYNHSNDLLKKYGDRLIMTHINDNLGISRFDGETFWMDDLHLLPFDGIADWDYNVKRLKKCPTQEFLNFELINYSKPGRHENDGYSKMTLEEYYTEAYKRACRLAYKFYEQNQGSVK